MHAHLQAMMLAGCVLTRTALRCSWLDNCGSFETLAPRLAQQGYLVCALDPPGCGQSQHLAPCCTYTREHESALLFEAAEALGWTEPFVVLAHSRGSGVAQLFAAAFPERVLALATVEGRLREPSLGGPDVADAPVTMRNAHDLDRRNRSRSARRFGSLAEAAAFSLTDPTFRRPVNAASIATAVNIAARQTVKLPEPDDQGKEVWALTHDVRAYGQSQPLVPTTASNNEVLELLRCPVLVIGAATKFCKPTTSCQPTADRLS